MRITLEPLHMLAKIADAYDANELDDEARKFWGLNHENENPKKPKDIILYSGRGGKTLLTLQDCIDARDCVRQVNELSARPSVDLSTGLHRF